MKRVLILGGDGMLGHQLFNDFRNKYEVKRTLSLPSSFYNEKYSDAFFNVNVMDLSRLNLIFSTFKPHIVINCIGIIKQRNDVNDYIRSLKINSLFPHQLTKLCEAHSCKLFHISTDCVFNGKDGNYTEENHTNAEDIYGKTKALGEIDYSENVMTLRTSIIGREIKNFKSLVEWFLSQEDGSTIKGYVNVKFNGFTTKEFGNIISMLIDNYPNCHGLYNVSSEKISKFKLLHLLNNKFKKNVNIEAFWDIYIDRSLDSTKFRNEFGYTPPSWEKMIEEM